MFVPEEPKTLFKRPGDMVFWAIGKGHVAMALDSHGDLRPGSKPPSDVGHFSVQRFCGRCVLQPLGGQTSATVVSWRAPPRAGLRHLPTILRRPRVVKKARKP